MKLKFTLLYLALFLMSAQSVYAVSPESISVTIAPENPAPNEQTNITVSSYASNLDSVLISWTVNGRRALSGIGEKSYSLMAPSAGTETEIIATVSLPDGVIEKRIVLRPSVIVLLSQANDSYVPPFYKGKALPTAGSEIKVVAMPEVRSGSSVVDPKNMTYLWKKDYNNDQDASGYGKNFYLYTSDYLEDSNNISVTASTIDQNNSVAASMDMSVAMPKINLYKVDNALGILYEHALQNPHTISGTEIVAATPYFISPKQLLHPRLSWTWFINDTIVPITSFRKNIIPLQAQTGVSGTSRLRVEIENLDKIWETANKEINIQF